MDEMTIVSDFARSIVSSFLYKCIRKKTGANAKILLKPFKLTIDKTVKVHLELDAEMSKEDFAKLIGALK